jgi:Tol biopolymer transport system component
MDTPTGPTENNNNVQQSRTLKKMVLGLVALGLIALIVLAAGAFLAFGYIRRTIEMTSLNIPLLADQPVRNQIAFVGNDDNLWLVAPDGSELRRVTEDGRGYRFPTWAPDGRRLAFLGANQSNSSVLYISPTSSTEPVAVFNESNSAPFYLYWAPNSRSITFLTQESSGLAMRQIDTQDPDFDRTLARGAPFYWVWSPESDKMLMHVGGSRATSEEAHISLVENQPEAKRIELDLAPGSFQAPVWSSDANFIYYIAADGEGQESIYRTNARTLSQDVVAKLGGLAAHMVLSPDDRHIAYLQLEGDTRAPFGKAYLAGPESESPKLLMEDPVASLYWSPDGSKLALLSLSRNQDGPTAKIGGLASPLPQRRLLLRWWIYDVETGELEPLVSFNPTPSFLQTVPFFDQYHLSLTFWSPDSRYFVVAKGSDGDEGGSVWVIDTTGRTQPQEIGSGTLAVWSWQ